MSNRDFKTWAAVNMGLKKPFGENGELPDKSEMYAKNAGVTVFIVGQDRIEKFYASVLLPPAELGFGIPKLILSEEPLSEEALDEACNEAAGLNCKWLAELQKEHPEAFEEMTGSTEAQ